MLLLVLTAACGNDDAVHHLPDAPPPPDALLDGDPAAVELGITLTGNGAGSVVSEPAGVLCGATCTSEFPRDTVVTLTAIPEVGSEFAGWTGACSGPLPTCEVTLGDAASATASFTLARHLVTVTRGGAGAGTVAGSGLDCGATCMITVDHGTLITLGASPGALSTFAGWGGGCTGTGTCALTVTAPTTISASFVLDDVTLFVSRNGTGAGTVTGAGISCGADCQQTYSAGQAVTLTAAPSTGSTFAGWTGGGCTGTGSCTVTMTAATSVTATFTLDRFALTVSRGGAGAGSVTSTPAGIACGVDCTQTYDHGTSVTLTPAAAANSQFTGWSGACAGTGACVVTMTTARAVTATFQPTPRTLTVIPEGTGGGTVTGTGISCGADCTETYPHGTTVTLTATPSTAAATASTFAGWSGACTGTGTCTVTLTSAATVNAKFVLSPNLMFVSSGLSNGSLGGLAGADAKCQQLAGAANLAGTYRAYLSSISGNTPINAPSRMGSASGWVRVDGAPLMNAISQFAAGTLANAPALMENGVNVSQTQFAHAWTGTNENGTFDSACSAAAAFVPWGGPTGGAMIGIANTISPKTVAGGINACDTLARLYCFGIDRAATLP
ncbi:MAG: hypothetical protein H0X17_16225 [Deltaproteobacteria bacterium]|nr:hypothetical protein [Deltaproteobacteria bacterium]